MLEEWEKQALKDIEDACGLCKYCPWTKGSHHPESQCDGNYCDKARENYLEEIYLQNRENK